MECKYGASDLCAGNALFVSAWSSSFVGNFPFAREQLGCWPRWKSLLLAYIVFFEVAADAPLSGLRSFNLRLPYLKNGSPDFLFIIVFS